jgi:hypothetical protein
MAIQKPIPFEVYRQGTAPEPPLELGVHGARLWRDVLTEIDITDAPRLTILEQAAFSYERAESLRREIAVVGELIETPTCGVKANPLIMAELQARSLWRGYWRDCAAAASRSAVPAGRPTSGRGDGRAQATHRRDG